MIVKFADGHYTPACECDDESRFVDGFCTTCGKNCRNCDGFRCIECEFGFFLDHTKTVCIDYCPTGSVYDDLGESGACVTDDQQYTLIEEIFQCTKATSGSPDKVIQREFCYTSPMGY